MINNVYIQKLTKRDIVASSNLLHASIMRRKKPVSSGNEAWKRPNCAASVSI